MAAQRSNRKPASDAAQTLCYCCDVSHDDIRDAVQKGARDFERMQAITGACMGCGTCLGDLERALRRAISEQRSGRNGQQVLPL